MAEKKKTCFIIMPITTPESLQDRYRDGADHFRHVLQCLLIPGVEAAGYKAIPPKAKGSDLIHAEIIANLEKSDMVLCDMSCLNPNVFFEFGIRTSLNKPVCVVKDEFTKAVPFDTGILNHHEYKGSLEPWDLTEEISKLIEHLRAAEERSEGENSLWKYFGFRAEAQPYAGGTDTDDKLNYLSMQMDTLRQQVGNVLERPEYAFGHRSNYSSEDLLAYIVQRVPPGVSITDMITNTEGAINVHYRGDFPKAKMKDLIDPIADLFSQRVYFTHGRPRAFQGFEGSEHSLEGVHK